MSAQTSPWHFTSLDCTEKEVLRSQLDTKQFHCTFLAIRGEWWTQTWAFLGTHPWTLALASSSLLAEALFHGSKLTLDSSLLETEQSQTHSFSTSHGGLEEDKDQPVTSAPTSSSKDGKALQPSSLYKNL